MPSWIDRVLHISSGALGYHSCCQSQAACVNHLPGVLAYTLVCTSTGLYQELNDHIRDEPQGYIYMFNTVPLQLDIERKAYKQPTGGNTK